MARKLIEWSTSDEPLPEPKEPPEGWLKPRRIEEHAWAIERLREALKEGS